MSEKKFSIQEAISFGWNIVKANLGFFVGFLVVAALMQYIPSGIAESLKVKAPILAFLLRLVAWAIQIIVSMGFIQMALKFHDGGKGEWSDLYTSYPKMWNYFLSSLIYGLVVFVGILLLIVPGIYWAIKYQFFGYLVVDKNMGAIEAIKASGEMTKGNVWQLFLFGLVSAAVAFLGALCLLVGLFVAIPVVLVAGAFVYRKLSTQTVS